MVKKYTYGFTCDEPGCNKTFSYHSGFKVHKLKHANADPPHVCDYEGCGKGFWTPTDLRRHKQAKHTHEKPFVCDHPGCDKAFVTQTSLNLHKNTHTGNRPYKCTHVGCTRAFAQSGTLRAHERTHTKEKPFVCKVCGKEWTVRTALNVHMRVHSGVTPYVCKVTGCGFATTSSGNLEKHTKSMHNGVYVANKKIQETHVSNALQDKTNKDADWTPFFEKHLMPPIGHFMREKRIDFSCVDSSDTYCRIDFVLTLPTGYVFLEVDENQHRFGYDNDTMSCDMKRMAKVATSLVLEFETVPNILWLRYNPHAWHVDGDLQQVKRSVREAWLVSRLRSLVLTKPLEIAYAFYDTCEGELEVLCHEEYHRDFRRIATNMTPNVAEFSSVD